MVNLLPLLAVALSACAPAKAQVVQAARIGVLIDGAPALTGAAVPSLGDMPLPPVAPLSQPAPQPAAPASSLVPAGLWATLAAPDAATLAWLSSRVPQLKAGQVRVLPLDAADAMFAAAVAQGLSPLDFFTDPGFRGDDVFYLPSATVAALFARYEVRVITPASGSTNDGKPYVMQGLTIGAGRIDALYDLDQFVFDNPSFPGFTYKLASRVSERIQAPGDLLIDGAWIRHGIVTPRITRIVKLSPTEGRVETNYGDRVKPVTPIRRRSAGN